MYERSLRCKPFERPKPLRRGQGVGGGNYNKISSGSLVQEKRPASRSTSPRRASPQAGPSGSCQPGPSRTGPSGSCQPGPSRAGPSGSCQPGPSRAGPSTSKTAGKSRPGTRAKTPVRGKTSAAQSQSRTPTTSRPSTAPNKPSTPSQARGSRPTSKQEKPGPARPGPSCLKTGNKEGSKNVKFPTGAADCSTNSRAVGDAARKGKSNPAGRGKALAKPAPKQSQPCPPRTPPTPVQGPSLYPIVPGQYESPFVSLPGPKQILLLPGDIDPNETTIIDIVNLDEGDIQEVPGIPPHAPKSLLVDGLKQAIAEHERWKKKYKFPPLFEDQDDKRKRPSPPKKEKKESKKPLFTGLFEPNMIFQGRSFPYEQFGNVGVQDPNNPPYEGPSWKAPDPECARVRPFDYTHRRTHTRPLTEEELQEVQDKLLIKSIRAVISENDARVERERLERGLADDDLMDIDEEYCNPFQAVEIASPDIFDQAEDCDFGESYLPRSPYISPLKEEMTPRIPCGPNLIAWDQDDILENTEQCEQIDFLTRTPPSRCSPNRKSPIRKTPNRQSPNRKSPILMNLCDPDEDILGIRTPPRPRTRSPSPCVVTDDDLIKWNEQACNPLPFDDPCEGDMFDRICETDMQVANNSCRRRSSPQPGPSRARSSPTGACPCSDEPLLVDVSSPPCGDTRIVKAVQLEDDPTTAVLEDSILASRNSSKSSPCDETLDGSFGILDYGDNCFNDDFDEPNALFANCPRGPSPKMNVSGVCPLNDSDDLDILDLDQMPEFSMSPNTCGRCEDEDDDLDILDLDRMPDLTASPDAYRRFQEEGFELEQGIAPCIDADIDIIDNQYEEEMDDFLHLRHQPPSPCRRGEYGRFGSELVQEVREPIEQCQDLLGLTQPCQYRTPPRRQTIRGTYSRQLFEGSPE